MYQPQLTMASVFGTAPNPGHMPQMPPMPATHVQQRTPVVEISDDDDDDGDLIEPIRGTNASSALPTNIRLKPGISPANRHDNKRQKFDDAPEASGSRIQYPRTRIEFTDDDGFAQFQPAFFFDDAFASDYRDDVSASSTDSIERFPKQQAIQKARIPPYYEDAKLKIRMYCGPGYEHFPLPILHDPKLQEACDRFDAAEESGSHAPTHQDGPLTVPQQDCLMRVLDVFPDVEHDFVLDRIKTQCEFVRFPDEEIEMHPDSAPIINEILEMESYPKQPKSNKESKDEFEDHLGKPIVWGRDHYQNPKYKADAVALLAIHFDHVPTHFINRTVMDKRNLFDAFVVIDDIESDYFQRDHPYTRSTRPRVQLEKKYQALDPHLDPSYYCKLVVELQAAKQHVRRKKLQTDQQQQTADAENANLEQQRLDGLLVQCKCCFDDEIPMNRTVVCLADKEHYFCYSCVKNLAENQIGMRRHEMQCMDENGCKEHLDLDGIGKAVPIKTFDRLQFNQQQAEIKAANIEGLEQCPLCDFQAICDPPEIDPVFSCQNPECFKVTCRLCHEISHLPKTCEEVKKDRGLSARHKVEEARSQAMIRTCPGCQSAIVKSDGCNRMSCTCGTIICYVCRLDLGKLRDAYDHFNRGPSAGKKCPLYDCKMSDRHVQEANEAEERAILEAKAEDNTIEEDTLRIETGKGKGIDRSKKKDTTRRDAFGIPIAVDVFANANQQWMAQDHRRIIPQLDGAGQFHENQGFMRHARNIEWLQGLGQHPPQAQGSIFTGFEPPQGRALLPHRLNEQTVNQIQQTQPNNHRPLLSGFGNPIPPRNNPQSQPSAFGIRAPQQNAQIPQSLAFAPGAFSAENFERYQARLQNHHKQNGDINAGPPPQMNDPNFFNADYLNTAQRIHDFRQEQDQRRREQLERRNTLHNQAPLQTPACSIFGARPEHNGTNAIPMFGRDEGFYFGMQLQQNTGAGNVIANGNNSNLPQQPLPANDAQSQVWQARPAHDRRENNNVGRNGNRQGGGEDPRQPNRRITMPLDILNANTGRRRRGR